MLRRKISNAMLLAGGLMLIPLSHASATVPNMGLVANSAGPNQTGDDLLPPAKCGECYARILVPAQYKIEKVKVKVRDASEKLEVVPPQFGTEEQTIEVSPAYTTLKATNVRYDTVKREILERPTHRKWKQGKGPFQTIDNATGEIMCLIEVPETFQTYKERIVARPAGVIEKEITAIYKQIRVKTLLKPAEVRRVPVEEEFKFLDKKVKTGEARIEWQPVLCQTNADRGTVRSIQRALRAAGTYKGYANGALNRKTMKGIRAYQAKNNLPQGQLTMATLMALGVNIMCDAAVTAPRTDTDGDGVYDDVDKCINEKGPARNSGCPDGDRDSDGIADNVDNCPDEKGQAKFQGCNEKQLVKMEGDKIMILEKVHFDFNKSTIQERSFPLLNNVAAVLKNHSNLRVRVEGHTDSVGPDAYNKKLSQARASAVRKYINSQKINLKRMVPRGFGEGTPIATNDTDEGRAQNRRVEFTIISQ